MNILKNKKLVLGSKSPRRTQLLSEAGFTFEVRVQDVDESFSPDMPVLDVAAHLAERKALALRPTLSEDEILVTADSVVILDNMIFNKPENFDDGIRILTSLSGKTHMVATGVCLETQKQQKTFTVITKVTFDEMSLDEMRYYMEIHKPYDKAGAYGIQDWIGLCKVCNIEGSYSNVMGLPVREVYMQLKEME